MSEQINFFEEIEEQQAVEKNWNEKRLQFMSWLTSAPWREVTPETENVEGVYFGSHEHFCDVMPQGQYAWRVKVNSDGIEHWRLSLPKYEGSDITICPYCRADLEHGKGQRFQQKWCQAYNWHMNANVRDYYGFAEIESEVGVSAAHDCEILKDGYSYQFGTKWNIGSIRRLL